MKFTGFDQQMQLDVFASALCYSWGGADFNGLILASGGTAIGGDSTEGDPWACCLFNDSLANASSN